jgi:hypothetical protein
MGIGIPSGFLEPRNDVLSAGISFVQHLGSEWLRRFYDGRKPAELHEKLAFGVGTGRCAMVLVKSLDPEASMIVRLAGPDCGESDEAMQ